MPVSPVVCPKDPLSRDLDVSVSISRPITEIATDMTMICFVTPDVEFSAGNGRVQFFSTMKALSAAVPANSAAYWAGNAFFSRDDRPKTLAVGRVFTEPTAAELTGGQVALSGLANVTDGAFDIEVNDTLVPVSGLSFDGTPTIAEVAEVLNTALASKGVTVAASGNALRLVTTQAGDGASLGYAAAPSSGTDVSALLGLTSARAASNIPGYTPGDLVSEIGLIRRRPGALGTRSTAGPLTRNTATPTSRRPWRIGRKGRARPSSGRAPTRPTPTIPRTPRTSATMP
ncbi:DUF3383 family protein [Bilophila wadsworthia]|uniref:DUF3383 family protein n=1 Tax=Bilophila wadsworthia TaxID=35833 RepID=UPI003990CE8A